MRQTKWEVGNFAQVGIFALCEFSRMHEIHIVREIAPALLDSCSGFLHFAGGESASPIK